MRDLFVAAPCNGCDAKNYTVVILQGELHNRDVLIKSLNDQILQMEANQHEMIKHMLGMNRNPVNQEGMKLHSIPRGGTIGDRIRRAERAESAPELSAQRRKEYEDRIASIMKPEVELVEQDAVQKSGTEQI